MRPRATPNNPCLPLPRPAAGEWCLPSLLSLFQLLVSCVAFTSASSDSWAGAQSACWAQSPEGAGSASVQHEVGRHHLSILGGRRGQLKAESLGALPGETASPPSPEHCEESWRCHLLPHSLLTPTARFGLQHVEAWPTAVQAKSCGHCLQLPVGISLSVGPFCVSHSKVSFLWAGVAAIPAAFRPRPDAW